MEMTSKVFQLHIGFISFLLTSILSSVSCMQSRKGFFIDDIDPSTLQFSKTIKLATIDVPSDLACSQKCFANELCSYKSYDSNSGKCQLYKQISSDDVKHRRRIAMKVNAKDICDSKDCGSRCTCRSLLGTEEYACLCNIEGLPETSSNYVHQSCSQALSSNGNVSASYFIQPSLKFGAVSLTCERGMDGRGYAVFHHNTEAEVRVTGSNDACGGYQKQFGYNDNMEMMIFVINNSVSCQQHTKAVCLGVTFVGLGCSWLKGRSSKKLLYWGGGPQNGTGCSCGVTGTCADPTRKCNCDINNNYGSDWHTDEGLVTLNKDLPLTGIAIGDTGITNDEVVKYTIGPLKCII